MVSESLRSRIEVRDLDFYYGHRMALNQVSIRIEDRRITSLIGPSGCGKSTLLRCLNRMNDTIRGTKVKGQVLLDGKNIYASGTDVVELRRRVGMVFQRPNPFPQSIFDNVAFGPRVLGLHKKRSLSDIVEESLQAAELWEEVKDDLKEDGLSLSLGQQQRLCIARVVAVQPDVILMDEPCSALDPIATLKIEDLMRRLAQDYTIIIVTHSMQQASRASDYTAFMLAGNDGIGRLIEDGPTLQIFTNPKDKRTEDYITGRFG